MERGLEGGGNAPITGPFPRPEGTRGTSGKEGEKTEKCRLFPQGTRKRGEPDAGRSGGERLGFSALFQSFCSYPLRPPGGASEGHAQAPRHAGTLPALRPGRGRDFSQVVPAPRQSLRRRAGVRTKGNPLVVTSCRPAYGDGCVRPPVPKAKLLLEQAGSEHRASARGKGGDSGVWKGASKGGNAPITGPFPPPGGHEGRVMEGRG